MDLTLEERETHFNMSADNRKVWIVYSDDPVMIRKLESIGAVEIRAERDGQGKHYELPAKQVTLRKPRQPMPAARKAQLAAQLAEARANA